MVSVKYLHEFFGINVGYIVALMSFLLFYSNSIWVLSTIVPNSAKKNKHQEWKWRNIANSLLHSFVTGSGACIYFRYYPGMGGDLIYYYNYASHFLLAISIGYFTYDFVDMVIHDLKPKTYTLLVHHILVVLGYGVAMSNYRYEGYTLCSLFIEVNSVFLHIRQIMLIQGWSRKNLLYRLNNSFNLGTFLVFRFVTMFWLVRFLMKHYNDFSTVALRVAIVAIAGITILNIGLLIRILRSDFPQYKGYSSDPKRPVSADGIKSK